MIVNNLLETYIYILHTLYLLDWIESRQRTHNTSAEELVHDCHDWIRRRSHKRSLANCVNLYLCGIACMGY